MKDGIRPVSASYIRIDATCERQSMHKKGLQWDNTSIFDQGLDIMKIML